MTGNTGNRINTGNTGNTGNAGISGDAGNWFIPDRVDLPFVTVLDTDGDQISDLRRTQLANFPQWSWAAKWRAS